jgi:putative ABC transport system permease protein
VNYFFIATRNLLHRKLRSLLTIIGIFIGIAAVVALVSLSTGLNNVIAGEFQKLGSDKIIIMPGGSGTIGLSGMAFGSKPLTEDDMRSIQNVPGVKTVGALMMKSAQIEFSGEAKTTFVYGIPTDKATLKMLEDSQSVVITSGRDFRSTDKYKVAVGSLAASGGSNGLFHKKLRAGNKIAINGQDFEVIAVLKSVGNPTDDKAIYIPMEAARELFNEPKMVSMAVAQTEPGASPAQVGETIKKKLRQRRGEKEGEETFSVQTPEQLQATVGSILAVIQLVVIGIAGISLLVGGIGIMNTMYTSVLERTREIGIMKAVGARNSDVMLIFLTESGMLGLVGGMLGMLVGVSLAYAAQLIAAANGLEIFKANFAPELIIGALLFSFVVGAVSGVLPARQAASLKPADALRYE